MSMMVGGAPGDATREYRSPLWQSPEARSAAVWNLDAFADAIRRLPVPVLHAIHRTEQRLLDAFLAAHSAGAGSDDDQGAEGAAGAPEAMDWLGFASRVEDGLRVYPTPCVIYRLREHDGIVHFYCAPSHDAALAEHLSRLAPRGGMAATSEFLARPGARIEMEHPAGLFPGETTARGTPATFADVALTRQKESGSDRSRYVVSLLLSA